MHLRNVECLSLVLAALTIGSGLQAQTWIKNPANGHEYALTKMLPWATAEAQAVKWGGHLVTIRSAKENAWILNAFPGHFWLWIGFSDAEKEGCWVWASGESSTYTNWRPSGPDGGILENFACIYGTNHGGVFGHWEDIIGGPTGMLGVVERSRPATFTTFGRGCSSIAVNPSISSSSTPKLGSSFEIQLEGFLPKAQSGQLMFGASDSTWGGSKLPMELSSLNMQGCVIFVSMDIAMPFMTDALGSHTAKFTIPTTPVLVGVTFYAQAWAPDPKANLRGLAMTNACKAVIGY